MKSALKRGIRIGTVFSYKRPTQPTSAVVVIYVIARCGGYNHSRSQELLNPKSNQCLHIAIFIQILALYLLSNGLVINFDLQDVLLAIPVNRWVFIINQLKDGYSHSLDNVFSVHMQGKTKAAFIRYDGRIQGGCKHLIYVPTMAQPYQDFW